MSLCVCKNLTSSCPAPSYYPLCPKANWVCSWQSYLIAWLSLDL